MAKAKAGAKTNIPNKILHSRVSYLYQAASYLATAAKQPHSNEPTDNIDSIDSRQREATREPLSDAVCQPAARCLVSDLRSVTLKGQMRMSPTMKHSICKKCDTLLMEGSTCTVRIENKSKSAKKPWADVLVRECQTCGLEKRFPIGAERQKRRPHRSSPDQKSSGPLLGLIQNGVNG